MMHFPNESEQVAQVHQALGDHLGHADRLLRFWLKCEKDKWLDRSTLPGIVQDLAMLLNIQACRQFRSVIEECRRSEGFCGSILSRSLFETVLAQQFTLSPAVCIVVAPELDSAKKPKVDQNGLTKYVAKVPPKRHKNVPADWLSQEFRAWLYFAHAAFDDERRATKVAGMKGRKRQGKVLQKKIDPKQQASLEARIGVEWTYILRHGKGGYSGLSVADLCQVLHPQVFEWYKTIYDFQSGIVHAADALRHIDVSNGKARPAFYSPVNEILGALQTAVSMFITNIAFLQNEIGFGSCVETAYAAFVKEFTELYA